MKGVIILDQGGVRTKALLSNRSKTLYRKSGNVNAVISDNKTSEENIVQFNETFLADVQHEIL